MKGKNQSPLAATIFCRSAALCSLVVFVFIPKAEVTRFLATATVVSGLDLYGSSISREKINHE